MYLLQVSGSDLFFYFLCTISPQMRNFKNNSLFFRKKGLIFLLISMCITMTFTLASCGDKEVGHGNLPDVYEISYYNYLYIGSEIVCSDITYGEDADGNVYRSLGPTEMIDISATDGKKTTYTKNLETGVYESGAKATINTTFHKDYVRQGAVMEYESNSDWGKPSEIEASEFESTAGKKSFLGERNCKYYKYTKEDGKTFALMAVEPESDLVFYYGDNAENGIYRDRFVVNDLKVDQTAKYADLLK
jgi:hypothetical protein